ncbi:MAG: divergent polysaccharide deacetylase family protein [Treponema sp.]|nr:divergent polysaccharide deacetylase family protein [Treponema sp.]
MPQKKTTRKTSSNTQRKTSIKRTSRRASKKRKVYISPIKAILFCAVIITTCMALLLVTNVIKPTNPQIAAMIERYSEQFEQFEESENQPQKSQNQKTDNSGKNETDSQKSQQQKNPVEQPKNNTEQNKTSYSTNSIEQKPQTQPQKPQNSDAKKPASPQPQTQKPQAQTTQPQVEKSKYNFPAAKNNAQLIFVFDDGGQNLSHLKPFLQLPFPITVAVLPQLAHSSEAASQVRKAGFEVMLHQPMQAINSSVNPGPGAIKPEMSENQILSTLFQNVTEIGPIAGMNNHEGSAITADAEKIATVMQFCSQEGIFFLDSRTNVETKVPYVARELGYSYYERNIFLDNEKTAANALKELKKGLELANKNGNVIMIGHIWSADFLPAFLQEVYPELKAKGYTFSTVSKSRARKN